MAMCYDSGDSDNADSDAGPTLAEFRTLVIVRRDAHGAHVAPKARRDVMHCKAVLLEHGVATKEELGVIVAEVYADESEVEDFEDRETPTAPAATPSAPPPSATAQGKRKAPHTGRTKKHIPAKKRKEANADTDDEDDEDEKEGRVSMMRQPGVPELGEVLDLGEKFAEYGECRSVPGFDKDKVRVFEKGWVQIYAKGRWQQVTRGNLPKTGRYKVGIDGSSYQVHNLLLRAFHGPKPTREHTGDHIYRNSTDNRVEMLKWETKRGQTLNREKQRLRSDAKPIYVQKLDKSEPPQWFEAKLRAAEALGLDAGNLSKSANAYKDHGKIWQHKGYRAWWAPAPEPQWDLLPGEDSNLLLPPVPGGTAEFPQSGPSTTKEMWKDVTDTFKLSDRMRIQQKHKGVWGYKRTPTPVKDQPYPTVKFSGKQLLFRGGIEKYNGKEPMIHVLVWMAFGGEDGVIPDDMTVDHLASDRKFDGRLCNLRTATRSQQIENQIRKPREELQNSQKIPIWGKPKDAPEEEWEWFPSQHEAADILNAREGKMQKFTQSHISHAMRGTNSNGKRATQHNGWVFKAAE